MNSVFFAERRGGCITAQQLTVSRSGLASPGFRSWPATPFWTCAGLLPFVGFSALFSASSGLPFAAQVPKWPLPFSEADQPETCTKEDPLFFSIGSIFYSCAETVKYTKRTHLHSARSPITSTFIDSDFAFLHLHIPYNGRYRIIGLLHILRQPVARDQRHGAQLFALRMLRRLEPRSVKLASRQYNLILTHFEHRYRCQDHHNTV